MTATSIQNQRRRRIAHGAIARLAAPWNRTKKKEEEGKKKKKKKERKKEKNQSNKTTGNILQLSSHAALPHILAGLGVCQKLEVPFPGQLLHGLNKKREEATENKVHQKPWGASSVFVVVGN